MSAVAIEEFSKIPFLDLANLQGRAIPTLSFFDGSEWHLWISVEGGRLMKVKAWPSEGYYFGKEAENSADVYLGFLDFIAQHCTWQPVIKHFQGVLQDFFNVCASIRKFDLLFEQSDGLGSGCSRLVITELEYLFSLCRSIFDLLQEIIAVQWKSIQLVDRDLKKKQLPESFANIVIRSENHLEYLRSEDELIHRFHIPRELAAFYVRSAPFFQTLRTFRDRFVHGGTTPEFVYVTEKGFAVPRGREPFNGFGVWNEDHMLPNELCSLRPAIGHIVVKTLEVCEDYAATIKSIIAFPPPIAPEMHLFVRGYFNDALAECITAKEKCLWWKNT